MICGFIIADAQVLPSFIADQESTEEKADILQSLHLCIIIEIYCKFRSDLQPKTWRLEWHFEPI